MSATDELRTNRPAFNASPSDVVCQWLRDKGTTRAPHIYTDTYAFTRAPELAGIANRNLQPEFVRSGLEYAGVCWANWLRGSESSHWFTNRYQRRGVLYCVRHAREVSNIGDFNCAREIGSRCSTAALHKPIAISNACTERKGNCLTRGKKNGISFSLIFFDSSLRDSRLYSVKPFHFNFVYRETSLFVHSTYRCVYCYNIIIFIVPFSHISHSRVVLLSLLLYHSWSWLLYELRARCGLIFWTKFLRICSPVIDMQRADRRISNR